MKNKILGLILICFVLMSGLFITPALADEIIEGSGTRYSTGESSASGITMLGYNTATRLMYLNYTLTTTRTVGAGNKVTFSYYATIYNSSGTAIGSIGTADTPQSASTAENSQTTTLAYQTLTLTEVLSAKNSIVITVISSTVGPV